jgi:protein-S-isoprenylcysteine O-methyltransferase Ste14
MSEYTEAARGGKPQPGVLSKLYGLVMFLISQVAIVLWLLFLRNAGPFKIDGGEPVSGVWPWLVNAGLVAAFSLQHLVMARTGFKRFLTKMIPAHLERSTFVGVAGLLLLAIAAFWQPLPAEVYSVNGWASVLIRIAYVLGVVLVVASTLLIDARALHGLKQSFSGTARLPGDRFVTPSLYKVVRHPMMTGFLLVLWATPDMTHGRLLIAATMSAFILVGIQFEERALLRRFGDEYAEYKRRVPALIPWPRFGAARSQRQEEAASEHGPS